jgi:hypothetical protein
MCGNRLIVSSVVRNESVETFSSENIGTTDDWAFEIAEDGGLTIIGCNITSGDLIIPKVIKYDDRNGETKIGLVKQIGDNGYNVFAYKQKLTSVTFSEGLEKIYDNAFYNCTGLSNEINFPSSLKSIGSYAFYNCNNITGDIISKLKNSNITKISGYAFYGCDKLTGEMELFDNISLGQMVFASCTKITGDINILLADGLTEIPDGAFSGMEGLTGTPNIPSTVTRIGNYAFYMCTGLRGTLKIPSACKTIGTAAFSWCSGFNYLDIDSSSNGKLEELNYLSFNRCSNFQNNGLSFPSSFKKLGQEAFYACFGITGKVTIPSNVTEIPDRLFCIYSYFKCRI